MLLNLLRENYGKDPNNTEVILLLEQYEKQRKYFLDRRIDEIKSSYGLPEDEQNVLLGFFNTFERESKIKEGSSPIEFNLLSIFKHHKSEDELVENSPGYSASLGWLRIYWSDAWRQFAAYNKYVLSARFAINNYKIYEIKKSYEPVAIDDLAIELKEILPSAEKFLGLPLKVDSFINPILDKNGFLNLDAKKLMWLRQHNIGNYTNQYIGELKQLLNNETYDIKRRLDVWDNPLYFSRTIAELRWKDRIAKLVHRKQNKPPALTYPFYSQVKEITKRCTAFDTNDSNIVSKEGRIVSGIGKAPGTTISTMEQITKSNLPLLSSITSHYLWRWFIEQVHKQHLLDIEHPYQLQIPGGYSKLGELSGAGESKEAISRIKKIIDMSSMCTYSYQGKIGNYRGNLLSFEYFEATGRKSSKLTVNLARPLCPGFVEELPVGNSKYHHQKMLVPWVKMPLLVGRNSAHHAPQSSFQLDMVAKMRLRAIEIYERGGILLNDDDLLELAKGANLPSDLITRVIDAWVSENYLERFDDCIYMLGNRYQEAKESLRIAGELSIRSAEKGRQRKKIKSNKSREE